MSDSIRLVTDETHGHRTGEFIGVAPENNVVLIPTSFAELYRTHFDASVRLARALTGSWEDASDITQDAFCGLHRKWRSIDNPEAYLRRSIVNGATSYHRRQGRLRSRRASRDEVVELGASELSDAIAALPDRQRVAVVLRYHLDLPVAEIAQLMGVRVGTVGSLLNRGLASLRAVLPQQ